MVFTPVLFGAAAAMLRGDEASARLLVSDDDLDVAELVFAGVGAATQLFEPMTQPAGLSPVAELLWRAVAALSDDDIESATRLVCEAFDTAGDVAGADGLEVPMELVGLFAALLEGSAASLGVPASEFAVEMCASAALFAAGSPLP